MRFYTKGHKHYCGIDLLDRTPGGILGVEIKSRPRAVATDARGLRRLADVLEGFRGSLVVTDGDRIECLDQDASIFAVPAYRLFL